MLNNFAYNARYTFLKFVRYFYKSVLEISFLKSKKYLFVSNVIYLFTKIKFSVSHTLKYFMSNLKLTDFFEFQGKFIYFI